MEINSDICAAVLSPGFDGQSMFATVATQSPRNSRSGRGGTARDASYSTAKLDNAAHNKNAGPVQVIFDCIRQKLGPEECRKSFAYANFLARPRPVLVIVVGKSFEDKKEKDRARAKGFSTHGKHDSCALDETFLKKVLRKACP